MAKFWQENLSSAISYGKDMTDYSKSKRLILNRDILGAMIKCVLWLAVVDMVSVADGQVKPVCFHNASIC